MYFTGQRIVLHSKTLTCPQSLSLLIVGENSLQLSNHCRHNVSTPQNCVYWVFHTNLTTTFTSGAAFEMDRSKTRPAIQGCFEIHDVMISDGGKVSMSTRRRESFWKESRTRNPFQLTKIPTVFMNIVDTILRKQFKRVQYVLMLLNFVLVFVSQTQEFQRQIRCQ